MQLEKQIVSKEQSRQYPDLSGDIAGTKANKIPSLETDFDTLNEPVWDTVVSFCVISLFFSSFECIYFVFFVPNNNLAFNLICNYLFQIL